MTLTRKKFKSIMGSKIRKFLHKDLNLRTGNWCMKVLPRTLLETSKMEVIRKELFKTLRMDMIITLSLSRKESIWFNPALKNMVALNSKKDKDS